MVAVSAVDENRTVTAWSNTGPGVTFTAPGVRIPSTWVGGEYRPSTGTSMACPHVAGVCAHLMADGLSNDETRDALRATATDLGHPDMDQGNGLPNAAGALATVSASDAAAPAFETRMIALDGPWTSVDLSADYSSPVVVAKPLSYAGKSSAHARLDRVTPDGFDARIEKWRYLNGAHYTEQVGMLGIDQGVHPTDTDPVEVRTATADHTGARVSFETAYSAPPVVLAQTQTVEGSHPVVARTAVDRDGFDLRVQEEESDTWHATETVGYVAIPRDLSTLWGRDVTVGVAGVDDAWTTVPLDGHPTPVSSLLVGINSVRGPDTVNPRFRNLSASSVELAVQEGRSRDAETNHVVERVGYVAVHE